MAQALGRKRRFVVIPWQMGLVARRIRCLPPGLWDRIMQNAPHKARIPLE